MLDIIISGSLAYDKIMDFPGYFKDHIMADKIHILSVSFCVDKLVEKKGGVAGNIAYSLRLLDENPKIIATAGTDFGGYRDYLEKLKIDTSGIKIIEDEMTAFAQIITDKADNQIAAFYPGAMSCSDQASLNDLDFDKKNCIVLVGPDCKAGMKKRVQECEELDIPFIFDPGQSITLWDGEELRDMVKSAKILIVNDYELELVQKRAEWSLEDVLDNVEVLIVTLGERGSVIYYSESIKSLQPPFAKGGNQNKSPLTPLCERGELDKHLCLKQDALLGKKKKIEISAFDVENVDPTGAGDAYRAGILKGIANGWDWEKTGKLASFCGACAVEHYGTQEHGEKLKAIKL